MPSRVSRLKGMVPAAALVCHLFSWSFLTSAARGEEHPSPGPVICSQAELKEFWTVWKKMYLRPTGADQLYVACGVKNGLFEFKTQSLSEGHGYGMLATVLLAGIDPQAQENFDALLRFRDTHPCGANPHLMAWRQKTLSGRPSKGGDIESATDGDLDIAYALLLAHRRWGGQKYLQQALATAKAVVDCEYNSGLKTLTLGSWCTPEEPQWNGWRTSDFMPGHFKALAAVTGDARWTQMSEKGYEILQRFVDQHSRNTGLVPDFLDAAECKPAPPNFLEDKTDGCFYYNACRVPWRLAADYVTSGDKRAFELLRRFNSWAKVATKEDPERFNAGYSLDGKRLKADWSTAFVGPLALAAMTQPEDRAWQQALCRTLLERSAEDEDYYGNSIKLMSLIVLGGCWQ